MPEYRRPALVNADPREVTAHLLSKGLVEPSTRMVPDDALYITIAGTDQQLTTALADYTPVAVQGSYRQPLPGDLPQHVQHLTAYLGATAPQIAAMTQAQKDHVLQDCVRALARLIDDRLGS